MAEKLKLGIIGMSEGNGHPYSWSAIFNGYNSSFMKNCPFPAIPAYLAAKTFPKDGLGHLGNVTHIWTQDQTLSKHIAQATGISSVVQNIQDMLEEIDAVLLARDDSENHLALAEIFLKAGKPIYIDKPFAIAMQDAEEILSLRHYESQIFTCSALRFAEELQLTTEEKEKLGEILYVEGSISKYWNTYAIHLLETIVGQMPERGELRNVESIKSGEIHQALIEWENLSAYLKVTGAYHSPLSLKFFGSKGEIEKSFHDSFSCFRRSLLEFVLQVQEGKQLIDINETLELVKILEWGKK